MNDQLIVVAGATGSLGGRIARELLRRGARVRALARQSSDPAAVAALRQERVDVVTVSADSLADATAACAGGACVISAWSGLRETIVGAQTVLLQGAIAAGSATIHPVRLLD